MHDTYSGVTSGLESPATNLYEVIPNDAETLPFVSRAINVEGTGTVRVTTLRGDIGSVTIGAGMAFPIRVQKIWATGTTATGIVVLF